MFHVLFCCLLLFGVVSCGSINYTNYSLIRSVPLNKDHLQFIKNISDVIKVDFWREPGVVNKPVDMLIGPDDKKTFIEFMNKRNYNYTTVIDDVQRAFDQQTVKSYIRRNMASFDWKNYYRLKDIYDWIKDLASMHPQTISIINIGKTYEKRDILAVKVVLNEVSVRSTVIVEGGIHAREWVSTAFVTYFMNEIVNARYSDDKDLKLIAYSYEYYFVPCLNPDGYEYSHTTDRNWRKNRRGSYGVDINRNFDSAFGTEGISWDKTRITYCGEKPFSERESVAMADLVKSTQDTIEYYLAFHSYGQFMIIPYAYSKTHCSNYDEMATILRTAGNEISKRFGTKYTYGTAYDTVGYSTSGVSGCWAKAHFRIPYVTTFELRDTGDHGFALPVNQIWPTCLETMDGIKSILKPKNKKYTKLSEESLIPDHDRKNVAEMTSIVFCIGIVVAAS